MLNEKFSTDLTMLNLSNETQKHKELSSKSTLRDYIVDYASQSEMKGGHWYFNKKNQDFDWVSHDMLARESIRYSEVLLAKGITNGDVCLIQSLLPSEVLLKFYACIYINVLPIILPDNLVFNGSDKSALTIQTLVNQLNKQTFIFKNDEVECITPSDRNSCDTNILDSCSTEKNKTLFNSNLIAYYQITSGTTGNGKPVAISHQNVINNVAGITEAVGIFENDIGVSWLPLYHDMGLVGVELFCFINNIPLVQFSPMDYIRAPLRWLQAIDRFGCTLAASPNFGYELCVKHVKEHEVHQLNLSSLRSAFTGGEPIKLHTIKSFINKFKEQGIRLDLYLPSYGMAETTLATTICSVADKTPVLEVDKNSMQINAPIKIHSEYFLEDILDVDIETGNTFLVSVGRPIKGLSYYLIDTQGDEIIGDQLCGEILVTGTSVALGLVEDSLGSIVPFENDTVKTGDIGFTYNGELYVVERIKNTIIINGKNYYAAHVEQQVAMSLDISPDCIAIFEDDISADNMSLCMLIEQSKIEDESEYQKIISSLNVIDPKINKIYLSKKRAIPRTTSGKKRYSECRKLLYEGGFKNLKIILN